MRGHAPLADVTTLPEGESIFCATDRKDRDLRDRNNLLRCAWSATAPAPASSKTVNDASHHIWAMYRLLIFTGCIQSCSARQLRFSSVDFRVVAVLLDMQDGFPRSRVGLAWEPLSIQARSASKGKRDPSPRNQPRIPSLARRACMRGRPGRTRKASLRRLRANEAAPPERRRRGAAEASGAGPPRPGARTPRVPSLTLRACMERGPRRTRLPHTHPHRQHHQRSARRELHEGIGLGSQTFEPRHTGHSGQQRCPHEGFTGEARA